MWSRARLGCGLAALLPVLLLPHASEAQAPPFPHYGPGCARADFASSATTIRAEFCQSTTGGRRAVVVLHGCGGFSTFDHRIASELPHYGISTLAVDFFGPTPPTGHRGFCGGESVNRVDPFPVWIRVARDAATALRATHGINPRGVGIVGWSLGGGVAIAAAEGSTRRETFDAVAAFSTGAFGDRASRAVTLPPTILLSAGTTDAIPLKETLPLFHAIKSAHIPAALYVYPRGSHSWPLKQGTLGIQHAALFLRRFLR